MALFQRNQQLGPSVQLYTLGQNKAVLIVGLGNVGREYDGTRHNIGFACLDAFASANDFAPWIEKKDLRCLTTTGTVGGNRIILCKPTTMMNLSGEAVQAVANFYKLGAEQAVVVHDELDIPFGAIRTRVGGSAAGHNGLKSIIQHFGEGFGRVRIGVGPKVPEQIDAADFVLGKFNAKEQEQLKNLTQETSAILSEYIFSGQLPHDTRSFMV
ncbi:MAG TPA: aminoacyl-tRNA hydrolase [Candidatus Saccharimonadales bacterium]